MNLPNEDTIALEYEVWFDIEEHWDYIYVEISVDGGENWEIIETPNTSSENPIGNGFGAGYTGTSDGWLTEAVDLMPFAGKDIWIRFQYITDDAINAPGACFRNLSISGGGVTANSVHWEADGFVYTYNSVEQDFQVQLITVGNEPQVHQLSLDANNAGEWKIQPPAEGERLVVSVGSLAEKTREPALYTIGLTPAR